MAQASASGAKRVHNALTAKFEKRLLIWMAERIPASIRSDHLTGLAFGAQLCAGASYALSSHYARALWLVNCFLFFNWLGDSLDGTLARLRHQERPCYGFYVDHIVDTLGALALMVGFGCSGYLHWQIAGGLLICFYLLSIESYLATHAIGQFHLSQGWFGPTEIRILMAIGNAVVAVHPYTSIAGTRFLLFDIGGVVAIAAMSFFALSAMARHTAVLYRREPLRRYSGT